MKALAQALADLAQQAGALAEEIDAQRSTAETGGNERRAEALGDALTTVQQARDTLLAARVPLATEYGLQTFEPG